jgi:release factor glutamine methyltransferase
MSPYNLINSIATVRHNAVERLRVVSPSPALDADMLLAEVLGVSRAYILAHGDQLMTTEQRRRFGAWLERAANGEPIAYILERRGFYDLDFIVTPDVLIPRQETELLLEQALAWAKDKSDLTVVDVGTGSGVLAVTFAKHAAGTQVYATDISSAALDVARRNAQTHGANVTFFQGDLLMPLIERRIHADLIMANLPYIASDEVPTLAVSHHEPHLALDGGADGLDLIRRLLGQIPQVCRTNALILLEIGMTQGAAALALAEESLHSQSAEVLPDYTGLDRIVCVNLKGQ